MALAQGGDCSSHVLVPPVVAFTVRLEIQYYVLYVIKKYLRDLMDHGLYFLVLSLKKKYSTCTLCNRHIAIFCTIKLKTVSYLHRMMSLYGIKDRWNHVQTDKRTRPRLNAHSHNMVVVYKAVVLQTFTWRAR